MSDDTTPPPQAVTTAAGLPLTPQATRYIPFTVIMPDGHSERAVVDAAQIWDALTAHMPHWLNPDVKHSFAEAEFRTTLKAGVKMARALFIDSFLSHVPAGYPKAPNKVEKGQDYLMMFGRYLFRLFVDIQAAAGGPVAVVAKHEATGRWAVTDVTLPLNVGEGGGANGRGATAPESGGHAA